MYQQDMRNLRTLIKGMEEQFEAKYKHRVQGTEYYIMRDDYIRQEILKLPIVRTNQNIIHEFPYSKVFGRYFYD